MSDHYLIREETRTTNPLCPHRSRCLAAAWALNPAAIDCSACPHATDAESWPALFSDLTACYDLLCAVFGQVDAEVIAAEDRHAT